MKADPHGKFNEAKNIRNFLVISVIREIDLLIYSFTVFFSKNSTIEQDGTV